MSAFPKLFARRTLAASLAVLVVGALCAAPAARAVKRYRTARFRADLRAAFEAVQRGDEAVAMPVPPEGDDGEDVERDDDAQLRRLANLAYEGVRGPAFHRELLRIAAEEARKQPESLGRPATGVLAEAARRAEALRAAAARKGSPLDLVEASLHAPSPASADLAVAGNSWVNLGPANQRFAYNGGNYTALDSGRPNTVLVDPRANGTVYVAFSGGGIWKTFEYGAVATPKWIPITEGVGNLAIGAIDVAKTAPDTLWAGLGDFVDAKGGQVLRSADGGGTWSAPIELLGVPAGASQTSATTVRDLKVAQDDANVVLVATDLGLFRSTNAAGAQPAFAFIDLPNGTSSLQEAIWSLAWAGAKTWVATGVQACAPAAPPPSPGGGQPAGSACPGGNLGDLWRSTDDGATWTSARAAGQLTSIESQIPAFGRATLAAAPGAAPASSVLYVFAGTADEGNTATSGILKSADGGSTWTLAAKGTTAVGNAVPGDCDTVDVGYQQAWYNQAIAVDPGDPSKVLIGGMLCSARSLDGGASWQLTSHWLPFNGGGTTSSGSRLPYAHADWHAATIARLGGQVVSFAGTDGGVSVSTNLFTSTTSTSVTWASLNLGLVTHLAYSIGSGDPAYGSQYIAFTGLQDNGTRFRDTIAPTNANTATTFNQVNGGDGFGVAWGAKADGTNPIYWASVYGNTPRLYCKPTASADCNKERSFTGSSPSLPAGDSNPFRIAYSEVRGDANSAVLSASNFNLWRSNFAGAWTRLTSTSQPASAPLRGIHASPYTYTLGGQSARLYGAPLAGGNYAVGTDKAGTLTWTTTSTPLGKGTGADAARFLKFTSALAFPSKATSLGGTLDGQAFLAASIAPVLDDATTPVPAAMGHLFKTNNNGATWTAFHGDGSGFDLPNVPVNVLRFDTGDATDQTIYVGTDLGLYRTTDGGATWRRFGLGLPMVKVTDIFISKSGELMRVSTFGRGLWELHPNAAYPKGFAGSGDYDLNLAIDFIDLAAMASRLGTSPATAAAPYYDWHLDLQGDQSAIDEADLSALLLKFGDRP